MPDLGRCRAEPVRGKNRPRKAGSCVGEHVGLGVGRSRSGEGQMPDLGRCRAEPVRDRIAVFRQEGE